MAEPVDLENEVPETDEERLGTMSTALKGTIMLAKPRVSKKVMVASLRGQNLVLQNVMKDVRDIKGDMQTLFNKTSFLRESVDDHETRIHAQAETIKWQSDRIQQLESTISTFESKIHLFDDLQRRMEEMERSSEKQTQMSNKQQAFNNRMQAAAEETRAFKQRLEKDVEQMQQEVKALPQTIVIDTSQVVDRQAEAMPGAVSVSLKDSYRMLKAAVDTHDVDIASIKTDIRRHDDEIAMRARIDYEVKVDQTVAIVKEMKEKMDSQDSVDLLDLRRNVNACLESLDEVKLDLMMKINASDVDEKIEERYEDIVDHLMKALKNVQDDEDDFRKATEDLHMALNSLKSDKADKGELDFVKQRIQRMSEEAVKPDPDLISSLNKRLTKEEVEEMIEDKVDKDELTRAIEDLTKTLNQYAVRLRKMGPGERNQKILGGIAKTLRIRNVDGASLLGIEPAKLSSTAFAITEGLLGKNKASNAMPLKICLSCHNPIPNMPKDKLYAGASYGGGFQLFAPNVPNVPTSTAKGPPLRTGTPLTSQQVAEPLAALSPNPRKDRRTRGFSDQMEGHLRPPSPPAGNVISL